MPYLIDGHNLIPYVPGLGLDQLDDEMRLVAIVEKYFRRLRKKAVVYFDRGQPGNKPAIRRGFVIVRFVRPPMIADQAINGQLKNLGSAAKNYIVVSSDQEVVSFATERGARTLSSLEFAKQLAFPGKSKKQWEMNKKYDTEYWLKVFGENS